MTLSKDKNKIEELLTRGVDEVVKLNHLKKRLLSGEKMRIKLGIDPTSPNIHIGRAVVLLKLRDFQILGHQIVLIIGDFTGIIGDTSDKESERPMLTKEEIKRNMETYIDQAAKVLNIDKVEMHHNSEWLTKLGYAEFGVQANQFSLTDFINRQSIKKRINLGKRVSLRELIYPLMQAYDSVAIKADVEIGGTDQRFNLLAGRKLQPYYKQEPQDILITNLIMGTDGRKMSSSWGNTINLLDEPNDMFGKLMSLSDDLIINYFEHCTRVPMKQVKGYEKNLLNGKTNPRDIKMKLAYEITKMYSGIKEANKAKEYFKLVFQNKDIPKDVTEIKMANRNIVDILVSSDLVRSKAEARRLISQGGIKVNEKIVKSPEAIVKKESIIQKGKRHFFKII